MKSVVSVSKCAAMPKDEYRLKKRFETGEAQHQDPEKREVVAKNVRSDEELFFLRTIVQEQAKALDLVRGSTSWRFSQPIRKAWTFVKGIAAKTGWINYQAIGQMGQLPFVLHPINDIEPDVVPDCLWRSTGNAPCFSIRYRTGRKLSGWYMIELKLTSTNSHTTASFRLQDASEKNTKGISLLCRNGQMSKRVVSIKKPISYIDFSPMAGMGRFCIDHLSFAKIPACFAVSRMIKKMQSSHETYRGKSAEEIKRIVRWQANKSGRAFKDQLVEVYSDVFDTNLPSKSYQNWIKTHEAPLFSDVKAIRKAIAHFTVKPLISIILPVHNTDEHFLHKCIQSVIDQSYPRWELCIADDASTDPAIAPTLQSYSQKDPRIKVVRRITNGHISAASNSALALASGQYVALLDHDDELAEHALYFVVKCINAHPDTKIIYSDEDKIDEQGARSDPYFKCDWNPDLLLSQNYISHLGVYRRELVDAVGGFREGVEGSQDYDLLLRCVAEVEGREIVHIPHVLYHWRAVHGSTALAADEKKYTTAAGIDALENYARIRKIDAHISSGLVANTYRVEYPIPDPAPLVSLIIPTRDQFDILSRCISSLLDKTSYPNYEIMVLDNRSEDRKTIDYLDVIDKYEAVRVIHYDLPFNYSAINNFGVGKARGSILGLINNDIEVISPDWLTEMVYHAIRPEIGCVGAKLYYPDERIQHAGVILGIGGVAGHSHKYIHKSAPGYFSRLLLVQNLSAVTAACMVVRRPVFNQVGGLNEQNLAVAFNDVDLCLRIQQAGYRNLWTPYAELIHHESVSRGENDSPDKIERFKRETAYMKNRWGRRLNTDPYYSPNLTLVKEDFSLA